MCRPVVAEKLTKLAGGKRAVEIVEADDARLARVCNLSELSLLLLDKWQHLFVPLRLSVEDTEDACQLRGRPGLVLKVRISAAVIRPRLRRFH